MNDADRLSALEAKVETLSALVARLLARQSGHPSIDYDDFMWPGQEEPESDARVFVLHAVPDPDRRIS